MRGFLWVLVFLAACVLLLGAIGKNFPTIDLGGLQWDHTVDLAKIRSEQEIALAREETVRLIGLLAASVGIVFVTLRLLPNILVLFVREREEIPRMYLPIQRDLARFPRTDLEIVEGEWCVVLPENAETGERPYFPAEAMLGAKRQIAMNLLEESVDH